MQADRQARLKSPAVIVEIGNDWLKLMQVQPVRGGVAVTKLHMERFDSIDSRVARSMALACKKQKFAKVPVIACLPRQMANVRLIELPSVDPAEIEDMVDLQVGKQTPYSRDEIVSDFKLVGSRRDGYTRVMLAIVQRSILRQRFHLLEEAGVRVARMSISSEGLVNWYGLAGPGATDSAPCAVLDLDSHYADFMVMGDGSVTFTRSILIGADQLVEDEERWREKLAREVERSIESARAEASDVEIQRVIVTGAGARMAGLVEYLDAQLGLPVEKLDSLDAAKRWPESPSLDDAEHRVVSMTPLVGMALAPGSLAFNLVPESVRLRRGLLAKARTLTALGMLLMVALVCASLYVTLKLFFESTHLAALERDLALIAPRVAQIERRKSLMGVVEKRRSSRREMTSLLLEIRGHVPPDVYLDNVTVNVDKLDEGDIALSGSAASRRDIVTLVDRLEGSSFFENVKEGGKTRLNPKTGRFDFRVVGTVEDGT